MALTALDDQHFYLDDKLVDLVWIGYQLHKQSSAANHHDIKRNMNWLGNLAERLLSGDVDDRDERLVRRRLRALGLGWYLEEMQ